MKIFNRIKNFFKKESRIQKILVGSTGMDGAIWPEDDYENFAKETYMKNVIAYKAIDEIAKNVASANMALYRQVGKERQKIDTHPIISLLKRPNPDDGLPYLIHKVVCYYLIAGNVYIERITPLSGPNREVPKELYIHRPDRMRILVDPDTGRKTGYQYKINSRSVEWEVDPITGRSNILHLKSFHPTDDWYGMAPTVPTAREIDMSNETAEWNKSLMSNKAQPGMLFMIAGNLSDEQYDRLEKRLDSKYKGPANVGKNLIIEGEDKANVQPYGFSPVEMDWIEGNRETARRIALGYGVPPMLLGIPGDNTYSNYKEARMAFWENTIVSYLNYLASELNNWFFADKNEDLFLAHLLDEVPALAPKREALWDRVQGSDFLTINEKREAVGYEAIDNGDEILVPATMIPLGEEPDMDEEDDFPDDEEDEEDDA